MHSVCNVQRTISADGCSWPTTAAAGQLTGSGKHAMLNCPCPRFDALYHHACRCRSTECALGEPDSAGAGDCVLGGALIWQVQNWAVQHSKLLGWQHCLAHSLAARPAAVTSHSAVCHTLCKPTHTTRSIAAVTPRKESRRRGASGQNVVLVEI